MRKNLSKPHRSVKPGTEPPQSDGQIAFNRIEAEAILEHQLCEQRTPRRSQDAVPFVRQPPPGPSLFLVKPWLRAPVGGGRTATHQSGTHQGSRGAPRTSPQPLPSPRQVVAALAPGPFPPSRAHQGPSLKDRDPLRLQGPSINQLRLQPGPSGRAPSSPRPSGVSCGRAGCPVSPQGSRLGKTPVSRGETRDIYLGGQ